MDGEASAQREALDRACDGTGIRDETEFRYCRFSEIDETMRVTGMGFEAE